SVIRGFTPVGRANHYRPSLKAGSIVKVDHFEVARSSSMYKITDHSSKQDYNHANSSGMTYQQLKLNSQFQAKQQMEANLSRSSSTSRQNQKIDVGGRLIKGILRRSETA
uniref:Uncharacterized protein n=2 Tax=Brassica oleracea TaxID=3712 RepID=A0A0D2ZTD4_BRAOL